MKKLNTGIKSLARALNTQSYVWQFNPSLSTRPRKTQALAVPLQTAKPPSTAMEAPVM
ncbi:hypothetical protein [Pyxidicoccus trucidator]|uniref:hypothetical protein n=1 Tax=Pyxidicoccus trucidator TaxID=2709662 RepID=UPI0013DA96EB|nr:hypothetical protein [Pyxidicoccus trucidator]